EFILRFLNSKNDYRLRLIRIFRLIQGLSILLLIFVCFTESNISVRIFPYASLVLILIFIASIIKRIRDGYTPAWFLLIGFIPLLFFGFISALRSIGILPSNLITLYGTLYASALDLVILSLGLAYSIRILQKNEMKAKLANQAKSEFIAQMSHEIRTPLQGLSASIDLLAEEKDTNQIKKLREILNSNLKNLTNILNDILDFSKIEAGFFTIHKEITDINQILLDLHFFYQAKMQEKKLEWSIIHPKSKLPLVFTDGTRLQQVLNNLISNAIKFTESGKVEVRYEIKTAKPKDLLYFEVEDTGLGIPKKSVDKLFNNFSQAETNTSHKYGGTGLGLAICKKIINLLDGKIGVDSEFEKGSQFYFEFPIDYAEKVGINPTQKEPSPLETVHKILILEDSLELQMLIRRSLEKFGYSVQVSGTVEEAIQLIHSWNPDVILSDYHLKGQTVIDFMKLLNKELAHKMNAVPKIYVLTGENSKSLHSNCLSMGIQKVFLKPLDFKEFNRVVKIDIS
ncbi:MAG: response regulator, partial [Leptospira sp.]|nr:response regulator [Leptospira sp.]